ncbi:hypothetical protein GCM10009809_15590 [Isoptericola hypogeus]|uniref:PGAP1-like protein n=1 Tax=Isoptericola hypogeus TaxID=300179 RepID=A0ABN2JAX1_9MICO
MTDGLPPADTLTVLGGRPLTRVDADAVRGAAALLDGASAGLRAAARGCAAAHGALTRSLWVPDPFVASFTGRSDPADLAARARAADLAADVAALLERRGEGTDRLALRLRLAAGLYERTESVAEQVVGGATTGLLTVVGRVLDTVVLPPLKLGAAVAGLVSPLEVGEREPGPPAWSRPAPPVTRVDTDEGGVLADAWRGAAPFADEAVAGLAWGVDPFGGVPGGAGELATLVRSAMADSDVQVAAIVAGGSHGPPAWAGRPSGTVAEALARTADLYPQGSGAVGRPGAGAPEGSVVVERVTHDDGTTSWTVLVPGTQQLLPTSNPFDALTDLELMAHAAADVTEAVTRALEVAGAAPDEPVVLVGHSLGGIAAVALASSPWFRARHRVGGVVTAGAPTATFVTPRGVPVLHLENDEELVSPADGRSSAENPATRDRVTVGRALRASSDPADRAASGSVSLSHAMPTHLRTLATARASGSVQVADIAGRLERLLDGRSARTWFFAARRVPDPGVVLAPGPDGVSPSSGRTLRRSPAGRRG